MKQLINSGGGVFIVSNNNKKTIGTYTNNPLITNETTRDKYLYENINTLKYNFLDIESFLLENYFRENEKLLIQVNNISIHDKTEIKILDFKTNEKEISNLEQNPKIKNIKATYYFILEKKYVCNNNGPILPDGMIKNGGISSIRFIIGKSSNKKGYKDFCLIVHAIDNKGNFLKERNDEGAGSPPCIGVKIPRDEQ
jgi:hypothetical protein